MLRSVRGARAGFQKHSTHQVFEELQNLEADVLFLGMDAVVAIPIALQALARLRKELRVGLEKLAVQGTIK